MHLDLVEPSDRKTVLPPSIPLSNLAAEDSVPPGEWTPNAFGCSRDCIVEALIHPDPQFATVDFTIETTVATKTWIWMATDPLPLDDGIPVMNSWPTRAASGFQHEWETVIKPLQYDTTYYVAVVVVDQQGNEQWAVTDYTTRPSPQPGDFTAPGSPCYFQCITDGLVFPGETYDTVDLVVGTNGATSIEVAVSSDEPWWIRSTPQLAADQPFTVTQDSEDDIRGTVSELLPDTTYHVVVKATDAEGFSAYATGTFHSLSAPEPEPAPEVIELVIGFNRIHVSGDGDPGTLNDGEISAAWGFLDGSYFDWMSEDEIGHKVASNSAFSLPSDAMKIVEVEPSGLLPNLAVNVIERDGDVSCTTTGHVASSVHTEPTSSQVWCGSGQRRINPAVLLYKDMDWVESLQTCSTFGYDDWRADHRCFVLESGAPGNQYATYQAIISFGVL